VFDAAASVDLARHPNDGNQVSASLKNVATLGLGGIATYCRRRSIAY